MFTGLIATVGKVLEYDGKTLVLSTSFRNLTRGESVSINGVCLTVVRGKGHTAAFEVGPETARVTTLGALKPGSPVNLERALRFGDRLGGHWVTGHVEGSGRIIRIAQEGRNYWFDIEVPRRLQRYVLPKGSIAIDGISLTVAAKMKEIVRIMIIPHTMSHTNLKMRRTGDLVNLETDLLAKYALQGKRPSRRELMK